jgi:hypothetical protein
MGRTKDREPQSDGNDRHWKIAAGKRKITLAAWMRRFTFRQPKSDPKDDCDLVDQNCDQNTRFHSLIPYSLSTCSIQLSLVCANQRYYSWMI